MNAGQGHSLGSQKQLIQKRIEFTERHRTDGRDPPACNSLSTQRFPFNPS